MYKHKPRKNSLWPLSSTVMQSRIYLSLPGYLRVCKPNMNNRVTMDKAFLFKSVNVASWFSTQQHKQLIQQRESTILGKKGKLRVKKKGRKYTVWNVMMYYYALDIYTFLDLSYLMDISSCFSLPLSILTPRQNLPSLWYASSAPAKTASECSVLGKILYLNPLT